MRFHSVLALCVSAACPALSLAYGTGDLSALTTFGSNGWLQPNTTYNTTGTTERGLAFGNGHLYLVSRASGNNIRYLDPSTGADLGGLNTSGISGGTFAENLAAVGDDGAIYFNNLQTSTSGTASYTIYKYASESAALTAGPSVAYSGNVGTTGARLGDTFAAIGSGTSTRLVSGFGTGTNGYVITDPSASTSTAVNVTGTNTGDFRLGITFAGSATSVLGTQTGGTYRDTTYSGSTGTLVATPSLVAAYSGAGGERVMAYNVVGGVPLLAVLSTGDSHVSLYDVTDLTNPVDVGYGYNIPTGTTLTTNANGTGQIAWGPVVGNTATLYTLSTSQGIEAYTVTVPEPASLALIGGAGLLLARKRRGE